MSDRFSVERHKFGMAYKHDKLGDKVLWPESVDRLEHICAYYLHLTRWPEHDLIPLADAMALVEALQRLLDNLDEGDFISTTRIDAATEALAAFRAKHGG